MEAFGGKSPNPYSAKSEGKVFFFAKSPDAPITTILT
jgi:hypothetical protein